MEIENAAKQPFVSEFGFGLPKASPARTLVALMFALWLGHSLPILVMSVPIGHAVHTMIEEENQVSSSSTPFWIHRHEVDEKGTHVIEGLQAVLSWFGVLSMMSLAVWLLYRTKTAPDVLIKARWLPIIAIVLECVALTQWDDIRETSAAPSPVDGETVAQNIAVFAFIAAIAFLAWYRKRERSRSIAATGGGVDA